MVAAGPGPGWAARPYDEASMTERSGWSPFAGAGGSAAGAFTAGPFTRLARVHSLSVAGDALIALSLAGSVFFSLPVGEARPKVVLYLVLTMAPFALVAPLIGPAIDRAKGGRRWMIVISAALRSVIAVLMVGHVDSLLLFPEAFAMLVIGKGYQVAKSAVVPTTVETADELVDANSKLAILTGLSGVAAGIPGGFLLWTGGPPWVLAFAAVVFAAAALMGLRLPRSSIATEPEGELAKEELRSTMIRLAASAMGLLRGVVGFLAFLAAFSVRSSGAPDWYLAVAVGASVAGSFLGSFVAPRVRDTTAEEDMLIGALLVAAFTGLLCAWVGGLFGLALMALAVGFCANTGKLAFDSLVQRDAPDANRGRSFARFETRFQLVWVMGALLPVALPFLTARVGYLVIAAVMGFGAFSFIVGRRQATAHDAEREKKGVADDVPRDSPGPSRKRRDGRQRGERSAGRGDPTAFSPRPRPRRRRSGVPGRRRGGGAR